MKKVFLIIAVLSSITCIAQPRQRTAASILNHFLHPSANYVLVTAHRGDWHDAPENSLEALHGALNIGVDIMETDIRKTKDGVLILMHDESINRTTSGKGQVKDLTWDYLKTLTLRKENGGPTEQHIPTFEAFMQEVKDKPILINLDKCWDIIPDVYAVLKKTGTVEQGLFKGNLPLDELRKKFGPIIDSIHYIPMVNPESFTHDDSYSEKVRNYVNGFLTGYKPAGYELSFDSETSPVLTVALPQIKKAGVTVFINSLWASLCAGYDDEKALINPEANWGWLIKQGANVIQTDQPQQLLEYLRKKKLHN